MTSDHFSITQLQQWMQGMLVHHVPVINHTENELPLKIEDIVNASQNLSAIRHLDIYRYSYIARLRSCMQSQFSALAYALGSDLFELFADQYLDVYPSYSYTLNTLGEKFPLFLEQTRPDADQEIKESWPDFMIELAKFEYALSLIFDQDATENNIRISIETPDEKLIVTPVFHLFHHQYPICNYYLEHSQGKAPELPFPEESYSVVTRFNYKLGLFNLRPAQYYFLQNMQQYQSVKAAKMSFLKSFQFDDSEFDDIWPQWKKFFTESGFFMAIER